MKLVNSVLLSILLAGASQAQVPSTARDIDWTLSTPGALDLAFDWVDAVTREADVIDEKEGVYAPREAEADTLRRKLQRKISWGDPEETPSDAAIYSAVVDFSLKVSTCRIMRDIPTRTGCSISELSGMGQAAISKLKEIERQSTAAERMKKSLH